MPCRSARRGYHVRAVLRFLRARPGKVGREWRRTSSVASKTLTSESLRSIVTKAVSAQQKTPAFRPGLYATHTDGTVSVGRVSRSHVTPVACNVALKAFEVRFVPAS